MLSPTTIEIVKSTAPVLAEEGENITRLFYDRMFADHPDLQNVFNMANQAKGEQARALADAVFAYATNIDRLEELGPVVNRIAHKHVSLLVTADQYPIVGEYLLGAIQDHLELRPDDPVLVAWAEAYGALAEIFIGLESSLYDERATEPGGWRGTREFRIAKIVDETPSIKSFWLEPSDGGPIAAFVPGQYIGITTEPTSSDYTEMRQYSLSNRSGEDHYRITVKAENQGSLPAGVVSNHLHACSVGDTVGLQPPAGEFVDDGSDEALVLIGGGIGITPLLSMLLDRLHRGVAVDRITLIHCCRSRAEHPMYDELRRLSDETGFAYHVAYEVGDGADHVGYLDSDVLERWLPADTDHHVFFCGPTPFMAALNILLIRRGYPEEQLHYEIFGPRRRFPATSA